MLMQVRVPGAARDFFLPESTLSADSLTVSIQPQCAVTCINVHAHIKNQTLATTLLFRHTKILHTPIGIGSTAHVLKNKFKKSLTLFFDGQGQEAVPDENGMSWLRFLQEVGAADVQQ